MVPRGVPSELRVIGTLAGLALLLPACSYSYPSAIYVKNNVAILSYKRCSGSGGIGSVVIRQGIPGDKRTPIVWTAKLREGATPLFELPLKGELPGYDVAERRALDPSLYYSAEAHDEKGFSLGGPDFRLSDLHEDRALLSSDPEFGREYELLSKWKASTADCPEDRAAATGLFAVIVVSIFFFGLVLSVIVVLQDRRRRQKALYEA